MLRTIFATAGLLLTCCFLSSCDSGGDSSKYADDMPTREEVGEPIRVDPIQAPGQNLDASQQGTGGR